MELSSTPSQSLLGSMQPANKLARLGFNAGAVLLGTLLIAICSRINVPVWPVPVTLQSLAVAVIAAVAGLRIGVATMTLYLLQGATGLPVFATGAGLAYLVGPTGGFLIGFPVMAAIIGAMADRGAGKPLPLFVGMIAGNAVLLFLGFAWLVAFSLGAGWVDQNNVIQSAFIGAVQPFLVWEAVKMALALATVTALNGLSAKR